MVTKKGLSHQVSHTAPGLSMALHAPQTLADILIEIRGVLGVYEVGSDGFLLSSVAIGMVDPDGAAAAAAVAALTSERVGAGLSLGALSWIILEFTHGTIVIARRGDRIWVVVTTESVAIGKVLLAITEK